MEPLQGISISPGFADGRAVVYDCRTLEKPAAGGEDPELEVVRLQRALQAVAKDLESLQHRLRGQFGAEETAIFAAHLALVNDPVLMEDIISRIRRLGLGAAQAIDASIRDFTQRLQQAEVPYLREREQDIRDVGRRLLRHLAGRSSRRFATLPEEAIIVAEELLPSDLAELDYRRLVGLVTERGGETGHVAILARSLGIPAITGIADATRVISEGQRLLLDGDRGVLVRQPTFIQLQRYRLDEQHYDEITRRSRASRGLPCVTTDGREVEVLANLGRPHDGDDTVADALAGVGLLRTEFLFLDHLVPPGVEEQVASYSGVARCYRGKPIVVRTLDLGGDKFPLFLERELEVNPNLGVRGLRFSLTQGRKLFRDQVRALLQVSTRHPISIMFPMVVSVEDLLEGRRIVEEIAAEENCPRLPPLGVLVETPAAVLMISDILAHVDFVSIGTNDLTQYMLAADRNVLESPEGNLSLHPAVLRAVDMVAQAAAAAGRPVSVCGEAAGVPEVACVLVGLGIQRLSMSPAASDRVRLAVRRSAYRELADVARRALAVGSIGEVRKLVRALPLA